MFFFDLNHNNHYILYIMIPSLMPETTMSKCPSKDVRIKKHVYPFQNPLKQPFSFIFSCHQLDFPKILQDDLGMGPMILDQNNLFVEISSNDSSSKEVQLTYSGE